MVRREVEAMADMRALEEEAERKNPLSGRKKLGRTKYPASSSQMPYPVSGGGATPSMGLSQFRGGAKEMGAELSRHIHEKHGAGFWSDFADGFKQGIGMIASPAKSVLGVIPHPAAQVASAGLGALGYGTHKGQMRKTARKAYEGKGKLEIVHHGDSGSECEGGAGYGRYEGKGVVGAGKKKRAPAGPHDARRKRAEVVKKVMAERGVSMIEASKIVKAEGLY